MRQLNIDTRDAADRKKRVRWDDCRARHYASPNRARMMLVACLIACAGVGTAFAAGTNDPRIPAHARIGNTPLADAKFEFACSTGEGGMLSIRLILPPPEAVGGFPLELFEGPDGIGETRDLAEWSVSGAAKPARARTTISGWRGVDGDGFLLSKARESAHSSDLARLAKRLTSSEQARLRLVVKPPAHGNALKVEAPIAGHREAIAKALAPCLATVK
jgi:hypothetical protein